MGPDLPTLEELAEVTGQDVEQLERDARAAGDPRVQGERGSGSAAADD